MEPARDELASLQEIVDAKQRLDALLSFAMEQRGREARAQLASSLAAAQLAAELGDAQRRLRALALATEAAGHDLQLEEAVRLGLETLQAAGLKPNEEHQTWDRALDRLQRDSVTLLAAAVTALAVAAFRMADYADSLHYAQLEVHILRWLGDEVGVARALIGLGWGYDKMGLYQEALDHHFRSLRALELLQPELVAGPLNGIAAAYLDIDRPEKAIEYGHLALAAATDADEWRDHNTALRLIGLGHQALGEVDDARSHFVKTLAKADPYARSLALLSLGDLALAQHDYDTALGHYGEALDIHRSATSRRAACSALVGMGRAHLGRGEPESAIAHLEEAIARGEASNAPVETANAHLAMSEALKRLGRYPQALEHHERFHTQHDRVIGERSDLRTQMLTIQFDVERIHKDREIDRLRNVELARAYADLRELHEQLGRQAAKLERLSRTDELTGLFNRRAFGERLEEESSRARRTGRPLCLLMIDLDDFKKINDLRSHAVGDEVLKSTGKALLESTRDVDFCGRIGGEEFVVLLPETDEQGAEQLSSKLMQRIQERVLFETGLEITASAGLALLSAEETGTDLAARADALLYQAKREGKNRVRS